MKASCKLRIKNPQGLHARPASVIVRTLQEMQADVRFTHKKDTVNARSIMSLLMLAATKNAWIFVEAEGEDAELVVERLTQVFAENFGE